MCIWNLIVSLVSIRKSSFQTTVSTEQSAGNILPPPPGLRPRWSRPPCVMWLVRVSLPHARGQAAEQEGDVALDEGREEGKHAVDGEGDEEGLPPADPIGQPAPHEGAHHHPQVHDQTWRGREERGDIRWQAGINQQHQQEPLTSTHSNSSAAVPDRRAAPPQQRTSFAQKHKVLNNLKRTQQSNQIKSIVWRRKKW